MDSLISQRLGGKYELQSEIGRGGMGIVYQAQDQNLRRPVAVKVLAPQLAVDPVFVQRFEQEAIAAANLHHPNIVTIHDVGTDTVPAWPGQSVHYIVMEFVEGVTLEDWLRRSRYPMTLAEVEGIVRQVAGALQYAHDRGMIHRDIKPSNIMLDRQGHVKLMDFGLVRAAEFSQLTRSGAVMGTPQYMSPEQVTGDTIDRRTDIYSFGIVIYELLAGAVPFVRPTPMATAYAHVNEAPPPVRDFRPDTPKSVEAVVVKALAKAPTGRYQTAVQLATDFEIAARGKMPPGLKEVPAAVPPAATRAMERPGKPPTGPVRAPARQRASGRRSLVLIFAFVLLVALLAGTALMLRERSEPAASVTPPASGPADQAAALAAVSTPSAAAATPETAAETSATATLTSQAPATVARPAQAVMSPSPAALAAISPTSTPLPARTRAPANTSPAFTSTPSVRSTPATAAPTAALLKPTATPAPQLLPAPELIAPVMDWADSVPAVTFQWLSIPDAAAYRLETRSDRPGQTAWRAWDPGRATSLSIPYASYPEVFAIPGTIYFWRVAAIDAAGRVGAYSGERRFVYQLKAEQPPAEPTPTPEPEPTPTPEPLPTPTPEPLPTPTPEPLPTATPY